MDENTALLQQVAGGDEVAFRSLYDRTYGRIHFFLTRMLNDPAAVEDVEVETYTAVWRGAAGFKGRSRATTWMIGIARNLALKELRKRRPAVNIDDLPHLSDGRVPDGEGSDRRRVVRQLLGDLSPKHREVLDLVFYHELSYQEIAELVGIPLNTVKTRVFHAKKAFDAAMQRRRIAKDDL